MRTTHLFGLLGVTCAFAAFVACSAIDRISSHVDTRSADTGPDGGVDGGAGSGAHGGGDFFDAAIPCNNLECAQQSCDSGETTVTGTVYAPNGKLPLYNAIVYVPNATPADLPQGATCDVCGGVTGDPLVTALSGADGTFTLHNVPAGKDIPLVIQIGKWRRHVVLPEVKACEDNTITDPELTRLPRNQSEGNMPSIAMTTGVCDKLGCMLPKIGIDPSEFGAFADGPSKAIHTYKGYAADGPANALDAATLWKDTALMKDYDMILLSCECSEVGVNKGWEAYAAVTEYLQSGGRIFTTDFMYTWYRYSPDVELQSAAWIQGGAPLGGNPINIDQSFPKGKALADWLGIVGVTGGAVQADRVFSNILSVDASRAQQWATSPNPFGPRVFTVNVPVGLPPEQQCGKGVHIDAHLNEIGPDAVDSSYPNGCNSALKPAEHLLAFFFFDLASCIQDEKEPPKPPQIH